MNTNELLTWMMNTVLVLGAAWGLYRVALRRERCFGYNRAFLLLAPLVAAGLPLLPRPGLGWLAGHWAASHALAGAAPTPGFLLPALRIAPGGWAAGWGAPGLLGLYAAGVALGLGRLAYQLWRLRRATRHLPRTARAGYVLAPTSGRLPTSSFGRTVFWDDTAALAPAEAAQVLAHEQAHVRQGHTYDALWLQIWGAVLWFNPFIYPLLRALSCTHELLADRAALAEASPATSRAPRPAAYAALLARLAAQRALAPVSLLHPFTQSFTLTRITMLNSSHPVRRWKQWLALPVVAGLLAVAGSPAASAQSATGVAPPPPPPPPTVLIFKAQEQAVTKEQERTKLYTYVEQMPELPGGGGNAAIVVAIQSKLKYPALAVADQQTGRVFVSFTVTKDGAVQDARIVKGLGPAYDEAVLSAVKQLPQFIPGRQNDQPVNVTFTVPVEFAK